jgi:sugar lactone lactonase YvrE
MSLPLLYSVQSDGSSPVVGSQVTQGSTLSVSLPSMYPVPGTTYALQTATGTTVSTFACPLFSQVAQIPLTGLIPLDAQFLSQGFNSAYSDLVSIGNGQYVFTTNSSSFANLSGGINLCVWNPTSPSNSFSVWQSDPELVNTSAFRLATDVQGRVYVLGSQNGGAGYAYNVPVRRYNNDGSGGTTLVFNVTPHVFYPQNLQVDSLFNLYVGGGIGTGGGVAQFSPQGAFLQFITNPAFSFIQAMMVVSPGVVYAINNQSNSVGSAGQLFELQFGSTPQVTYQTTVAAPAFCLIPDGKGVLYTQNQRIVPGAWTTSALSFATTPPKTVPVYQTGMAFSPSGNLYTLMSTSTPSNPWIGEYPATFVFPNVTGPTYNTLHIQNTTASPSVQVGSSFPMVFAPPARITTFPSPATSTQPCTLEIVRSMVPPLPGGVYHLHNAQGLPVAVPYTCPVVEVVANLGGVASSASSLAVLADGSILFTDCPTFAPPLGAGTLTIYRWDSVTQWVSPWLSSTSDPALAASAALGLAVDASNRVYVACQNTNLIRRYAANASGGMTFVSSGLDGPMGMAFDSVGCLYVANRGNDSVCQFSPTGALLKRLAGDARLCQPCALAVNGLDQPYVLNGGSNGTGAVGQLYFLTFFSEVPSVVALDATFSGGGQTVSMAFDADNNLIVPTPGLSGAYSWFNTTLNEVIPLTLPALADAPVLQSVVLDLHGNAVFLTSSAPSAVQLVRVPQTKTFKATTLPSGTQTLSVYSDSDILTTFSVTVA